jgi:uncharacterized protein YaaN involved in tellurite resistance
MSDKLKIDSVPGSASPSGVATAVKTADPAASVAASGATTTSTALVLTPPEPVAIVPESQAADAVALDPATESKLDTLVAGYLDAIASLDPHDPEFEARASEIRKLGDAEAKASAQLSSRLLNRPVASLERSNLSSSSSISKSLMQLRRQVDDLDPAHQGDLFSSRKLFGIIPFGDKLRNYFARYRSSQNHINAIIKSLENGQGELSKDNADLEQEKTNLWAAMERLRQYIYLGQKLDAGLAARIAAIETSDPERAKVLEEDLLFYARQKVQDLTTQLAVSVQGYLAMDVIRRNNLELIRGVDRATTTTVSALRTAVIVAQALGDQKLVLDQITALNTTTSNLIESTSAMLRQQSAAVNEQAASATIDIGKLQVAFDNIYATMDEIDAFKLKSLDNMTKTISDLTVQIGKAQTYLDRARSRDQATSGDESGLSSLPE